MNPLELLPLQPTDVVAGVPLQCDIYSSRGALLLRSGGVVRDEQAVIGLLSTGRKAKRRIPAGRRLLSSYAMMDALSERLDAQIDQLLRAPHAPGFVGGIRRIADTLIAAVDLDADASFAQPHLDCRHGYMVYHATMAAVVSAVLAAECGLASSKRQSLVCAALTHDISLFPDHQKIEGKRELSEIDRNLVSGHANTSARILGDAGVSDADWLQIVECHHERLDGSGYPQGLTGDALPESVRIMSIADALSAMLRPRPYRGRRTGKDALTELYRNESGAFDGQLIGRLIKRLGVYPPGSVLRLERGEVALVVRPGARTAALPEVVALIDPAGRSYLRPVRRDVSLNGEGIAALLKPSAVQAIRRTLESVWGDQAVVE